MLSIFFIGLALSMDAFSLSVSAGTTNIDKRHKLTLALSIAVMHFIMPQIGLLFGEQLFHILPINIKIFNIIVFTYLGITMLLKKENTKLLKYSIFSCLFLAFCVSIDSFSIGLGLSAITSHYLTTSLIFGIISGGVSYLGLLLGERIIGLLKEHATKLGGIILLFLAFVNLMKELF